MNFSDDFACGSLVSQLLGRAEHSAAAGRIADACRLFERAIDSDPGLTARNAYGCFLFRLERFHQAIEQFTCLLDEASAQSDPELLALASHNLAAVFREVGLYDLAARFQQRAAVTAAGCDRCDLLGLASDALVKGRRRVARKLVGSSLGLSDEEDSPAQLADDFATAGVAALLERDAAAVRLLWSAYHLHRLGDDWRGMGKDLWNLAVLMDEQGRSRGAIRCLRRALACYTRAGAHLSANRTRDLLRQRLLDEAIAARHPRWN